jgi:hypothetical protein
MSWALLRSMPPIEDLYDYYDYNAEEGIITRKGRHRPLGYIHRPTGYRLINYSRNGVKIHFYAQRLAYTLYTGTDPYPLLIDHINRDKDDNRIINLRTATHIENRANTTPRERKPRERKPPRLLTPKTDKGYSYSSDRALCVYQRKKDGRWFVLIDNTYYGTRATQEEAIILRDEVIASKRKV